ncbi:hypothetical protein [Microvirga sp. P5_D2]
MAQKPEPLPTDALKAKTFRKALDGMGSVPRDPSRRPIPGEAGSAIRSRVGGKPKDRD